MENIEFEKMFEKLCKVGEGGKKNMKLFVKHPDRRAAVSFLIMKVKDYINNFEKYREDEKLKFGINFAIQILGMYKATESIDLLIEVVEKGISKIPGMFSTLAEMSLVSIGKPSLEPLYKKYRESMGNSQFQSLWLGILAQISIRDKRIHDAILKCFEDDPLAAIRIVDDCLDSSFLPAIKKATKKAADYLCAYNINPLLYSGGSDIPEVEIYNSGRDLWVNLEIGFIEDEEDEEKYYDRIDEINEKLLGLKTDETLEDNNEQEPDETDSTILKFEKKVGRNDPRPCGSGKKYKKCCKYKDEERNRLLESNDFEQEYEDDEEENNSKDDYFDAFYENYESASLNKKIKMLEQLVEQEEPFPEFYLVVGETVNPLMRKGKYKEVLSLIDHLKVTTPLSYEEDDSWFEAIRIESILKSDSGDDLTVPLTVFAKNPEDHIDGFFRLGDMLMYYGRASELVQAMITAWHAVEKSNKILFDGIPDFQERISTLLLFGYVCDGNLEPEKDNNFIQLTEPYRDCSNEWFERVCRLITSRENKNWSIEDFDSTLDNDKLGQNLFLFTLQFLRYLWREKKMNIFRAELARGLLADWISRRLFSKKSRSKKLKKVLGEERNILLPSVDSLDEFLAEHLGFLSPHGFKVAALWSVIPLYVEYLEMLQLVDPEQSEQFKDDIKELEPDMKKILETMI